MKLLRWVAKNLGTLILSFVLAMVVWVSSVLSADPNEVRLLPRQVPVEYIGQNPELQIIGSPATTVRVTLNAPKSIWNQLISDDTAVRAFVDLSNLDAGQHTLSVQIEINLKLVHLVTQEPEKITVELDPFVTIIFPVELGLSGSPPTGYKSDTARISPPEVSLSGPQSQVSKVREVRTNLDISGETETITKTVSPLPLDAAGKVVTGVRLSPETVTLTQPINLLGGFRYVIVKAVTAGQVANGYKLTNIYVSPAGVVVFSSDPEEVTKLPGYIETQPIDLGNAEDDFEKLVELNLPGGLSVVGDPKVLIQVSIAAIESNLAVSIPVEMTGLTPGYAAVISPGTVDIILAGPVPVLNNLKPSDIRVKVDLTGYDIGSHQIIPVVDFLPENVRVASILPFTVEVTITLQDTPTPTLTTTPTPLPTRSP